MKLRILLVAILITTGFSVFADSEKSGILVVEFQKTWTERSLYHKFIKKEYESRGVYNNSIELLNSARKSGTKIIHAPLILDRSNKEIYKKMPLLPKLFRQFTANTWKAEYTEGIFWDQDLEVKGRTAFDATVDSNLIELLEENEITKVYIIGFTTDHCVSDTLDSLISRGFKCALVSDCTATKSNKTQIKYEK